MPPRSAKTESVVISKKAEKVHSVVYMAMLPSGESFQVYLPKGFLASFGNPAKLTVTFSA